MSRKDKEEGKLVEKTANFTHLANLLPLGVGCYIGQIAHRTDAGWIVGAMTLVGAFIMIPSATENPKQLNPMGFYYTLGAAAVYHKEFYQLGADICQFAKMFSTVF